MQTRLTAQLRGTATTARPDPSRRRALFMAALLAVWMLAVGARLVYLQIYQHQWLSKKARSQQQVAAETSSGRGLIVDRENRELARSAPAASIFADPHEIEDLPATASRLAPLLGKSSAELIAQVHFAKQTNRRFVWLARKIDQAQAHAIAALKLRGIHFLNEAKRVYPHGSLAAHVLGFVGTDETGLGGVEQMHNAALSGKSGHVLIETDGRRRAYQSLEIVPRAGQTVQLTIDQAIQYHAEQVMADALAKTRARAATAVVLDPHSGEILALVNAPSFDRTAPAGSRRR
ncbi:MAG: hypothetical protein WKF30_00415 [Pyrinomonadaceae bacterium]